VAALQEWPRCPQTQMFGPVLINQSLILSNLNKNTHYNYKSMGLIYDCRLAPSCLFWFS